MLDADAGIYRDADGLRRALAAVEDLRARYDDVRIADTSAVLNTDWATTVELGATLLVAHATVAAALARESRAAPTSGWTSRRRAPRRGTPRSASARAARSR